MKKWVPLWVIPLLVVFAIGTVWLRLSIVDLTYQINDATNATRATENQREQMALRVAGQRSPRKLEAVARTKFGLSPPRAEQVIPMESR